MDEPGRSPSPPAREAHDHPPPAQSPRVELELLDATARLTPAQRDALLHLARRAMDLLPNTGSVRVRVVDDDAMDAEHQRHSGIAGTTDVLTYDFAQDQAPDQRKVLDADLTLCLDEAQRRADERGHAAELELLLYTIHGVLHCLGHDDHEPDQYARMHQKEDELLTAIGVGPLFAKQPAQQPSKQPSNPASSQPTPKESQS